MAEPGSSGEEGLVCIEVKNCSAKPATDDNSSAMDGNTENDPVEDHECRELERLVKAVNEMLRATDDDISVENELLELC